MSSLSVTSEPQQYIVSKEAGVSGVTLMLPVAVLTTAEAAFSTLGLSSLLSHLIGHGALKILSASSVTL